MSWIVITTSSNNRIIRPMPCTSPSFSGGSGLPRIASTVERRQRQQIGDRDGDVQHSSELEDRVGPIHLYTLLDRVASQHGDAYRADTPCRAGRNEAAQDLDRDRHGHLDRVQDLSRSIAKGFDIP